MTLEGDAGPRQRGQGGIDRTGRHHQGHAHATVEDAIHLGLVDRPQPLDLGEDARLDPRRTLEHGADALGEGARQIADDAPAGDVGARVQTRRRAAARTASTEGV